MHFGSILIVTYGRSGSTLLQGVLNTLPNVLVRGENYDFCWGLYQAWKALRLAKQNWGNDESSEATHAWFGATHLDPDRFLQSCRVALLEQLEPADQKPVQCLGFKEIRYLDHLDELFPYLEFLRRLLPNPAIIFNTRLHEDVCRSAFWKKQDPTTLSQRLAKADRLFFEFAERNQSAFVVRYENLIRGWSACLPLFDFLGARPDKRNFDTALSRPHSFIPTNATLAAASGIKQMPSTRVATHPGDELVRISEAHTGKQDAKSAFVTVFATVRDELTRLPWFLSHYRALGCRHFVFIDNESADGTTDYLRSQSDVTAYHAPAARFGASCSGRNWINWLVVQHGGGRWALCADADELLTWPGFEQEGLQGLVNRAERLGLNRVFTPMIDAYADCAVDELPADHPGLPFGVVCPWVDPIASYRAFWNKGRLVLYGGPRDRHAPNKASGPIMSKQSLYKVQANGYQHLGAHFDTCGHPSPLVAPFLHYRFLPDFADRVDQAIAVGQHWNNAADYRGYKEQGLSQVCFMQPDSVRIRSGDDLRPHIEAISRVIRDAGLCGSAHCKQLFKPLAPAHQGRPVFELA